MIHLLKKAARLSFSLPKTIYFNFCLFEPKIAVKLPILVDYRTKFCSLHRNTVVLNEAPRFGMIKVGWGEGAVGNECNRFSYWTIKKECKVAFVGSAHFARGVSLRADEGGQIVFGKNFTANQNFFCATNTTITFGDNVLAGWNIHIRDGDGHQIFDQDENIINTNRPISIGSKVWIGSYATVLKGVTILDNSIVALGAIVTKSFSEPNIIIGGIPAVMVKKNVRWEK